MAGKGRAEFEDYEGFVEKFKPRKTTDDCMTPPEVYDAVLAYVAGRFGVDPARAVRPFWPGGDYEGFDYPEGCTVVDNPPFSCLSRIVGFYVASGTPFFLFAPSLTCFGPIRAHLGRVAALVCDADVTYENGATVRTAFLTSLLPGVACEAEPGLGELVNAAADAAKARMGLKPAAPLPRYEFPDCVLTAARLQWMAGHGEPLRVMADECAFVRTLDSMRAAGKSGIFGGGLLLGEGATRRRAAAERAAAERAAAERAAAERAAAERAAAERWGLSDAERQVAARLA